MKIFVVLALIVYVSASLASAEKQDIQGEQTQSRVQGNEGGPIKHWVSSGTTFPFIVSIRYKSTRSHFCGGSIISSNKVITAAHCTAGQSASYINVAGGQLHKSSNSGQIRDVSYISIHPNYNSKTSDYDFAVLTLSSSFSWNSWVTSIRMGSASSGTVYVAGWGAATEGTSPPDRLHYNSLPIVSNEECNDNYGAGSIITSRMMCAGLVSTGGKDTCQGDGGGPLTLGTGSSAILVGVVSWGYGCARIGYPGVYARISAVQGWINSQ